MNTKIHLTRLSPISVSRSSAPTRSPPVGAAEILDVVRTHQFAVTKRRGSLGRYRNRRTQTSEGRNQAPE